jgi:hypothetical protein
VQDVLDASQKWATENKIEINPQKTKDSREAQIEPPLLSVSELLEYRRIGIKVPFPFNN